jgi:aminoglycoside 2'-N-acetyltransferase I
VGALGAVRRSAVDDDLRTIVASTDKLDAETRAGVVALCVAAHAESDFERLFEYIPAGGRHFLAYRGHELAAHAVVTTRWLHTAGQRLKTAYVDAVATLPRYQGAGYGSAVMRLLADNVADYDISCLETERPQFYARLGWELWRGPLGGLRADVLIPTPEQEGIMILRTARTPPLDLDRQLLIEWDGRLW